MSFEAQWGSCNPQPPLVAMPLSTPQTNWYHLPLSNFRVLYAHVYQCSVVLVLVSASYRSQFLEVTILYLFAMTSKN